MISVEDINVLFEIGPIKFYHQIHPIIIKIGFLELRWYSLMYIIAFLLGIFLATKDDVAKERGIKDKKVIEDFAFFTMLCGLIGARLYYVLFNLSSYLKDPISIFKVWEGGLAIHGGIIGGLVGVYLFAKKHKINMWILADMAVGPLLLGQTIGRFGNFANGEIHGVPTNTPLKVIFSGKFNEWYSSYLSLSEEAQKKFVEIVPWGIVFPEYTSAGMEFPNQKVHPAMLYELVLNFICFLLLWFFFRKKRYNPGVLSMIYLIMYALIRSFVSFFRAEDLMFFNFMRAPHAISIIMIVLALIGINYFNKKNIL